MSSSVNYWVNDSGLGRLCGRRTGIFRCWPSGEWGFLKSSVDASSKEYPRVLRLWCRENSLVMTCYSFSCYPPSWWMTCGLARCRGDVWVRSRPDLALSAACSWAKMGFAGLEHVSFSSRPPGGHWQGCTRWEVTLSRGEKVIGYVTGRW